MRYSRPRDRPGSGDSGNAVLLFPRTAAPVSSKTLDCEHIAVVQTWGADQYELIRRRGELLGPGLAIGSYRRTGRGGVATTTWSDPRSKSTPCTNSSTPPPAVSLRRHPRAALWLSVARPPHDARESSR
ncbi:MAG: hypothetical protein MZV70_19500 [Desulfobacterales bacterium]|nr:hypothetical protein [Desulfobacterales bacterium]